MERLLNWWSELADQCYDYFTSSTTPQYQHWTNTWPEFEAYLISVESEVKSKIQQFFDWKASLPDRIQCCWDYSMCIIGFVAVVYVYSFVCKIFLYFWGEGTKKIENRVCGPILNRAILPPNETDGTEEVDSCTSLEESMASTEIFFDGAPTGRSTSLSSNSSEPSVTQLHTTTFGDFRQAYKMDNLTSRVLRNKNMTPTSPLILTSLDPIESNIVQAAGPVMLPPSRRVSSSIGHNSIAAAVDQFESLNINASLSPAINYKSVHLLDENEHLLIQTEEQFNRLLNIERSQKIKVVSIMGNTGEGKSHTMNHVFFDGEEVFPTSARPDPCTLGVRAMYDPVLKVLCMDTEGLLGISKKEHQRTRLLLKVLAVSDIIIYRTKAERLHTDMYSFLGNASKCYKEHFTVILRQLLLKHGVDNAPESMGPALIIFHETNNTNTLDCDCDSDCVEDVIRENFLKNQQSYNGFSSMKYLGQRNTGGQTSFKEIRRAIMAELSSTLVRSARESKYIFCTLKGLNDKFQCAITAPTHQQYLPQFFTCQDKCLSCEHSCTLSMGHKDDNEPHFSKEKCKKQHQYQNFVYLCKKCNMNGTRQVVEGTYRTANETIFNGMFKALWTGYVMECPTCGEIYRQYQHWYGNKDPGEHDAIVEEVIHVWPGEKHCFQDTSMFGTQNSAQKVIDGVTTISNVVASVGSQPTRLLGDLITDTIAPDYWRPNKEITECFKCKVPFTSDFSKHHCRACGEGFCDDCSSKKEPVPTKNWHDPVRVCDGCYGKQPPPSPSNVGDVSDVRARQYGETLANSVSLVKNALLGYTSTFIKDQARPSYWEPDNECVECWVCKEKFGPRLGIHHCRECGKGVCDKCSHTRKHVPMRNFNTKVRVCDDCA